MNGHLMTSRLTNIHTKNFKNLFILVKVTIENVGDVFLRHSVLCNTV